VINKFLITEKKRGEQFVVPLFLFYLSPFGFKSAKVRKRPLRYLCTFPCRFVSTAATWHLDEIKVDIIPQNPIIITKEK